MDNPYDDWFFRLLPYMVPIGIIAILAWIIKGIIWIVNNVNIK